MQYSDIFHSIIHELNFFNSFFYEQYVVDTSKEIVFNVLEKTFTPLTDFLLQENLTLPTSLHLSIHFTSNNNIIIASKKYPQYLIFLKINTSLAYLKEQPFALFSNKYQSMYDTKKLSHILQPPHTSPTYLLYFQFLTNCNVETPIYKELIFNTVSEIFKEEISYFKQVEYNAFLVVIKDCKELDIYRLCKQCKTAFSKQKKAFLLPQFLLVEYNPSKDIEIYFSKLKILFNSLVFTKDTLLIKQHLL